MLLSHHRSRRKPPLPQADTRCGACCCRPPFRAVADLSEIAPHISMISSSQPRMHMVAGLALLARSRPVRPAVRCMQTLSCAFGGDNQLLLQCNRLSPMADGSVLASYGATSGSFHFLSNVKPHSSSKVRPPCSSCDCRRCRRLRMGERQMEQSYRLLSRARVRVRHTYARIVFVYYRNSVHSQLRAAAHPRLPAGVRRH